MRNLLAGLALLGLLTGCGLPPALSVASTVADGFSYVVSGKSVSDHALSMVASRDCAMMRVLDGREICADVATDESAVLLAAAPPSEPWAPVDGGTPVAPVNVSLTAGTAPTVPVTAPVMRADARFGAAEPLSKPAVASPANDGAAAATLTVLGSYRDHANAEREVVRLSGLQPRVMMVMAAQGPLYRVVSEVAVARARAAGIADAWPLQPEVQLAANL